MAETYDRIGAGYARRRRPDARIARAIAAALGDARSVVDVGAGTGSYEPPDRRVVAVEPALTMIRQRAAATAAAPATPVIRARAEALPFAAGAFDAALAVLSIHHVSDWRAGARELCRVARARVVLFTWDPDAAGFWLGTDYLPELWAADRRKFPAMRELAAALGGADVVPVPIPHDCADGFMGAYWRRPAAYLDPEARAAISTLAGAAAPPPGLARLADDLASGAWTRKHGDVLARDELDVGYRLVVTRPAR